MNSMKHYISESGVDLQKFIIDYFLSVGAIIDVPSFALVEIVLPENVQDSFNGQSFLKLAFDYEVAQENEDAEFVTYGSPMLDSVVDKSMSMGQYLKRYAIVDNVRIPPKGFQWIREKLNFVGCKSPSLDGAVLEEQEYLLITFRVSLESDEKVEMLEKVFIDRTNAVVAQGCLQHIEKAFLSPEPIIILPRAVGCGIHDVVSVAKEEMERVAYLRKQAFEEDVEKLKSTELKKIEKFYDDNRKHLLQRLAKSKDGDKSFEQKLEANEVDHKRRIEDVNDKYKIKTNISIDSVIVHLLPKARYSLKLVHNGQAINFDVTYNLLSNEVDIPICPLCRKQHRSIYFNRNGQGVCKNCI